MIPFDITYIRPDTVDEAISAFHQYYQRGQKPAYYGGGTEIVSQARLATDGPRTFIDIKAIADCRQFGSTTGWLVLGAGLTLAELARQNMWPLLAQVATRIADHSTRCQITLGGNIAGALAYREAVLPFLLTDTQAVIAGYQGVRTIPLATIFRGRLELQAGEFLVQLKVPETDLHALARTRKRTRLDWVDYPLVTVVTQRLPDRIGVALSGLAPEPIRAGDTFERTLAESGSPRDRVHAAMAGWTTPMIDDMHGSAGYRRFILTHTLEDLITELEA